ncbi:MAG: ABC transporter permease subunit [Enterocloster sp.]
MRQKTLGKLFPYLLILPSLIILAGVVFYPIAASLLRSFQLEEGGWGLDNYIYFFTDPIQRKNILYTLQIVIVTVVLAIGISYFLAIYLRFSNSWASRMIGRLYLLPRFIPGLVAVNGMITVIRDSGLINRISRLLGMNLQLGLMYNGKGIVLMNLWFNIPFATMLMAAALSKIPDSTIEAARDAGAERFRILRQMILPLTYRDLFVAATFVFMSNISSFTTPYLMDGNNPQMMGISLYTQFNNGHYEKAAALSVIMFLFSVLSAAVYVYTNMKKMNGRKEMADFRKEGQPCPIAHRGCMEAGPENSLTAFEEAAALGAGGVEMDVRGTGRKAGGVSRCRCRG